MAIDRYTTVVLSTLDRWVRPNLATPEAQDTYRSIRESLVRLALAGRNYSELTVVALPAGYLAERDEVQAILVEQEAFENQELAVSKVLEGGVAGETPNSGGLALAQLETYLWGSGSPAARVTRFEPLKGGKSKQTILVEAEDAVDFPAQFVIRRDANMMSGNTVAHEFSILKALADRGLPVPRPFRLETHSEVLGGPALFVEFLPGRVVGGIFDPPETPAQAIELANVLGQVAAIPLAEVRPHLDGRTKLQKFELSLSQIEDLRRDWTVHGRLQLATVNFALRWLEANFLRISSKETLVHGGTLCHNILFDGDHLTGLLDWEGVGIGHPAWDVGNVKDCVTRLIPWTEFEQAYFEAGGPRLDPLEVDWFAIYTTLWNIKTLHRLRNSFESGATSDVGIMELCLTALPRFMERLSRRVVAIVS